MGDPVKQVKTGRTKGGTWKKGCSGNPNGRPHKPEIDDIREALAIVREKYDKSFLEHFVERAYKNDQVAIALAKKIIPEKTNIGGATTLAQMMKDLADAKEAGEI